MDEKKDVVPSHYRDKYKDSNGGCGDFIAEALTKVGKDGVAALDSVKRENGIEPGRWSGFNPGMQRMNLANVLRSRFLKGETIKVLGKEYNAKHQAEDFNGKVEDDAKSLGKLAEFLGVQVSDRNVAALQKVFFPPQPKGPTAEERAAAKKQREDEKAEKKATREREAAERKATREAEKKTRDEQKVAIANEAERLKAGE